MESSSELTERDTPPGQCFKIFSLKHRLVIADIYAETVKSTDGRNLFYDFPAWVKKIDKDLDADTSVSALTDLIKNQMTTTFAFAINAIKAGQITKEQAIAAGIDKYLVQYVIAGYERGIPVVYSLTLMPDWDSKTVNGPFQVPLKENSGEKADSHILWRGQGVGIEPTMITDSKEQHELADRVPVEFTAIGTGKSLSLKEASNMVRALLGIEAKANPTYVALPFTVATVPKAGNGWVRTYETDVSPLSALPKPYAGKTKK